MAYDFLSDLGDLGTLIEFDGGQHFFSVDWFGGESNFALSRERDVKKTLFALEHKIPLIRFDYRTLPTLATHLDTALRLTSTAELILSDAHIYDWLIQAVLAARPDTKIAYTSAGPARPLVRPDWTPEGRAVILECDPDFDLSRDVDELDRAGLVELYELLNDDIADEGWTRAVILASLTEPAGAPMVRPGLQAVLEPALVEYVLRAL